MQAVHIPLLLLLLLLCESGVSASSEDGTAVEAYLQTSVRGSVIRPHQAAVLRIVGDALPGSHVRFIVQAHTATNCSGTSAVHPTTAAEP